MPPHAAPSYLPHTHTHASSLPLGAIFIWGIKNPLSLDPIDIWVSISEIKTASGQYPATLWSRLWRLAGGGGVATRRDQKGAVLCLLVCVCVCVCVFSVLLYSTYTHAHWVCRDGSVEVWKSDFVPFVSLRAAPLVLHGWRYEQSQWEKKAQLSLRQALPTRVSPFETQCPAYPPQSTFG